MEDHGGRIGWWVSGTAHAAVILWAILGGVFLKPQPSQPLRSTEVATISGAEFEALAAASRGAGPVSDDATMAAAMQEPAVEENPSSTPASAILPDSEAQAQELARPVTSEAEPDLSDFVPQAPVAVATDLGAALANQGVEDAAPRPPENVTAPVADLKPARPTAPVTDQAAQPVAPRSQLALDRSAPPRFRPDGLVAQRNARLARQEAERQAEAEAAIAAQDAAAEAERLSVERQLAEDAQRAREAAAEAQRQEDAARAAEAARQAEDERMRAQEEREALDREMQAQSEQDARAIADAAERERAEELRQEAAEAERLATEQAAEQLRAEAQRREAEARLAEQEAAEAQQREAETREAERRAAEADAEARAAEDRAQADRAARTEASRQQALEDALREAQDDNGGMDDAAVTGDAAGVSSQTIEDSAGVSAPQDPLAAALSRATSGQTDALPTDDPFAAGGLEAMQLAPSSLRQQVPGGTDSMAMTTLSPSAPLSLGEKDAFRTALRECWNEGALSLESASMSISVAFSMSPDGRPIDSTLRLVDFQGGPQSGATHAFGVARRAIVMCGSTGFPLPLDKHARWRNVVVEFRPDGIGFD